MSDGIYLVKNDSQFVEMRLMQYESEALLQHLLARYPQIIAGDLVDSIAPRKWLLVTREMGIPDEEGGGGRWSVDHLFIDQDGIPTFVEVKRSTDTRIRREVVGQMLDYAANALRYWPANGVREVFEKRCVLESLDPQYELEQHLGDTGLDEFWSVVSANLERGRVRLVFVADLIPPELQTIIEFLYMQMSPAEVIGIEVKQYTDEKAEHRTLVPRLVGATESAKLKKSASTGISPAIPALSEAIAAFRRAAKDSYIVKGSGSRYRQIQPTKLPQWPSVIHYEVIYTDKDGLAAELHLESDSYPAVAQLLPQLAEQLRSIEGQAIHYDPAWSKNRGRLRVLIGNDARSENAATIMLGLIRNTEAAISEALLRS